MAEQDIYFAQAAEVARALGADPVPTTRAQAEALIAEFRPDLVAYARCRDVARMVLTQPAPSIAMKPVQTMLMRAAAETLPQWAQEMHQLTSPRFARPFVRTGAFTLAHTLRWAFHPNSTKDLC